MENIGATYRQELAKQLLRLLKSEINLRILALLSSRPSYARELALLLEKDETDISRRLTRMEKLGILEGVWTRIEDRNVKLYRLTVEGLNIRFLHGRIVVSIGGSSPESHSLRVVKSIIPDPGIIIGREKEKIALLNSGSNVVHVWGPPGIGKTSLVADIVSMYARERPVYWYRYSHGETQSSFRWRLGVFIQSYVDPSLDGLDDDRAFLEALESSQLILVVDDFHLLDEGVRRLVRWLAKNIEESRIYILSRERDRRLPLYEGKVFSLGLEPLSIDSARKLIEYQYKNYGISVDEDTVQYIIKASQGIPLLIKSIIKLNVESKLSLDNAVREILDSYYNSQIAGLASEEELMILELLSVVKGHITREILCRITGTGARCRRILERLFSMGLIIVDNEYVALREYLYNIANSVPSRTRRNYTRILSQALYNYGDHKDKIRALDLLSEQCMVREAVRHVSERLALGSSWFLCCPDYYLGVIDKLLSCPTPNTYQIAILNIEKALIGYLTIYGKFEEALRVLDEYIHKTRNNPVLYTRIMSLYSMQLFRMQQNEKARKILEEASRVFQNMTYRQKRLVAPELYGARVLEAYTRGDIREALDYARLEARAELDKGDLLNYAKAKIDIAILSMLLGMVEEADREINDIRQLIEQQPPRARNFFKEYINLVKTWIHLYKEEYSDVVDRSRIYKNTPRWRRFTKEMTIAEAIARLHLEQDPIQTIKLLDQASINCKNPKVYEEVLGCYARAALEGSSQADDFYEMLPIGLKAIADRIPGRN